MRRTHFLYIDRSSAILFIPVLLSLMIPYITGEVFTIVPETQYVYLYHSVTFECATNLTGYTLTFGYQGTVNATVENTIIGNVIKATTTFVVFEDNNSTGVRCIADKDNMPPLMTSFVYAYAQG